MGLANGAYTIYSGILMLIVPILATYCGYIAGSKKFEFVEKLKNLCTKRGIIHIKLLNFYKSYGIIYLYFDEFVIYRSRDENRIHIFTGHFGSGKTEVALNFALQREKEGEDVVIVDLDIVNPYFRTNDARNVLMKTE